MILVNGTPQTHIEICDRGFQYGDGLFTSIEISNGYPVFFDLHLERLTTACSRLSIPYPGDELLAFEAGKLCKLENKAVLKIILTRGKGGRGYRCPDHIQTTRVLSLHPFPDYPDSYQEQGIIARFCNTRLGLNPQLAGIKHLNRLEQVLARAEWQDLAIAEGIMQDCSDNVIEGVMSNLFYVEANTLYTASLSHSGVAGIVRQLIIKLAKQHAIKVIEHNFTTRDLLAAEEVFVCNSIIGIWPVKEIGEIQFSVGVITKQLQSWFAEAKQMALQ